MAIAFQCDHCGRTMRAGDDKAGRRVACKDCGEPVTIPGGAPARKRSSIAPRKSGSKSKDESAPSFAKFTSSADRTSKQKRHEKYVLILAGVGLTAFALFAGAFFIATRLGIGGALPPGQAGPGAVRPPGVTQQRPRQGGPSGAQTIGKPDAAGADRERTREFLIRLKMQQTKDRSAAGSVRDTPPARKHFEEAKDEFNRRGRALPDDLESVWAMVENTPVDDVLERDYGYSFNQPPPSGRPGVPSGAIAGGGPGGIGSNPFGGMPSGLPNGASGGRRGGMPNGVPGGVRSGPGGSTFGAPSGASNGATGRAANDAANGSPMAGRPNGEQRQNLGIPSNASPPSGSGLASRSPRSDVAKPAGDGQTLRPFLRMALEKLDDAAAPTAEDFERQWAAAAGDWDADAVSNLVPSKPIFTQLDGKRFDPFVIEGAPSSVVVSPAGGPFALSGRRQLMELKAGMFDLRSGRKVRPKLDEEIKGSDRTQMALSPTGLTIVNPQEKDPLGRAEASVAFHDGRKASTLSSVELPDIDAIVPVSVQDDRFVALVDPIDRASPEQLRAYDPKTGQSLYDADGEGLIDSARFKRDHVATDQAGTVAAILNAKPFANAIQLIDLSTGERLGRKTLPKDFVAEAVGMTADGATLAVLAKASRTGSPAILFIDAASGDVRSVAPMLVNPSERAIPGSFSSYDYNGNRLEFFPDGDFLLVDGVEVWSVPLGRAVIQLVDLLPENIEALRRPNDFRRLRLSNGLGLIGGTFKESALAFLPLPLDEVSRTVSQMQAADGEALRPGQPIRIVPLADGTPLEGHADTAMVLTRWGATLARRAGLVPVLPPSEEDDSDVEADSAAADWSDDRLPQLVLQYTAEQRTEAVTEIGDEQTGKETRTVTKTILNSGLNLAIVDADGQNRWTETVAPSSFLSELDSKSVDDIADGALLAIGNDLAAVSLPYFFAPSGPIAVLPTSVSLRAVTGE